MKIAMPIISAAVAVWLMCGKNKLPFWAGFNAACAAFGVLAWFAP